MDKPVCKRCGTTEVLMKRQILQSTCWKCAHFEHDLDESKTRILIYVEHLDHATILTL